MTILTKLDHKAIETYLKLYNHFSEVFIGKKWHRKICTLYPCHDLPVFSGYTAITERTTAHISLKIYINIGIYTSDACAKFQADRLRIEWEMACVQRNGVCLKDQWMTVYALWFSLCILWGKHLLMSTFWTPACPKPLAISFSDNLSSRRSKNCSHNQSFNRWSFN